MMDKQPFPVTRATFLDGQGTSKKSQANAEAQKQRQELADRIRSELFGTGEKSAQQTQAQGPIESSDLFLPDGSLNVSGYLQSAGFSDKSQAGQREMLQDVMKQASAKYGVDTPYAKIASAAGRLPGSLVESDGKDGIKDKRIETSYLSDVGNAIYRMGTSLLDTAGGLTNLAIDADWARDFSQWAKEVNEDASKSDTADYQDYEKRFGELADEGRWGALLAHAFSNPFDTLKQVAIFVGPTLGAGAAVKGGAKLGTNLAVKAGVKEAGTLSAKAAARQNLMYQSLGIGLVSTGHTAQQLGAGQELTGEQKAGAVTAGVADTILGGLAMKYGVNFQNLLSKVGRAADPRLVGAASPEQYTSVLRGVLGSTAVDMASNAPSGALNAVIRTGYDEQGNWDASRIDPKEVEKAVGSAMVLSPMSGGVPGGYVAWRGKQALKKDANGYVQLDSVAKDKAGLAEKLAAEAEKSSEYNVNPEWLQAALQEEAAHNEVIKADLDKRVAALERLRDRAFGEKAKLKYTDQINDIKAKAEAAMNDNPVDTFAQGYIRRVTENLKRVPDEEAAMFDARARENREVDAAFDQARQMDEAAFIEQYRDMGAPTMYVDSEGRIDTSAQNLQRMQRDLEKRGVDPAQFFTPPELLARNEHITTAEAEGLYRGIAENGMPSDKARWLSEQDTAIRQLKATEEAFIAGMRREDGTVAPEVQQQLNDIQVRLAQATYARDKVLSYLDEFDPALALYQQDQGLSDMVLNQRIRDVESVMIEGSHKNRKVDDPFVRAAELDILAKNDLSRLDMLRNMTDESMMASPEYIKSEADLVASATRHRTEAEDVLREALIREETDPAVQMSLKAAPLDQLQQFAPEQYHQRLAKSDLLRESLPPATDLIERQQQLKAADEASMMDDAAAAIQDQTQDPIKRAGQTLRTSEGRASGKPSDDPAQALRPNQEPTATVRSDNPVTRNLVERFKAAPNWQTLVLEVAHTARTQAAKAELLEVSSIEGLATYLVKNHREALMYAEQNVAAGRKADTGRMAASEPSLRTVLDAFREAFPKEYESAVRRVDEMQGLTQALRENTESSKLFFPKKDKADSALVTENPVMAARLMDGDLVGALRSIQVDGETHPIVQTLIQMLRFNNTMGKMKLQVVPDDVRVDGIAYRSFYDTKTGTAYIRAADAANPEVLVHETTHHVLQKAIGVDAEAGLKLSKEQLVAVERLRDLYHAFTQSEGAKQFPYAAENVHEFTAGAFADPALQAWLRNNNLSLRATNQQRKGFGRFISAVRKFLGLGEKEHSSLTDVIGLSRYIVGSDVVVPGVKATNFGLISPKVFGAAHLKVYVEGEPAGQTIGTIVLRPSGEAELTNFVDGNRRRFDTMDEAAQYAYDTYRARPSKLVEGDQPVMTGVITPELIFGPSYTKAKEQAFNFLSSRFTGATADKVLAAAEAMAANLESAAGWMMAKHIDAYAPLKAVDRIAQSLGIKSNIYQQFTEGQAQARAMAGRPGPWYQEMVTQLRTSMSKIGLSEEKLSDYMYAMRTKEMFFRGARDVPGVPGRSEAAATGFRVSDGKGGYVKDKNGNELVDMAAVDYFMSQLSKEEIAQLESIAAPIYNMNRRLLAMEYEAGVLSKDQYRRYVKNTHYVPLLTKGQKLHIRDRYMTGRTTKADDPLAHMLSGMQERYAGLERNKALRSLASLAQTLKLDDLFEVGTYEPLRQEDGMTIADPTQKFNDKRGVWVLDGDRKFLLAVKTDNPMGRDMLKAIQRPESNLALDTMRNLTGYTASMMTTYNPKFLITTPVWDMFMTMLNFSGAYDRTMSTADHYRLAMKSVREGVAMLPQLMKERWQGTTSDIGRQIFGEFGGGNNAGAYFGLDSVKQPFNDAAILGPVDAIRNKPLSGTWDTLKNANSKFVQGVHAVDEAFRYATFKNFLEFKTGIDIGTLTQAEKAAFVRDNRELIMQAAKGSRELAGNFTRRGNGKVFPAWFAFWNAGMQSIPLIQSLLSTSAGRFGMMGLMGLGILSAEMALSDPDDEDFDGGSKFARSKTRETSLVFGDLAINLPWETRTLVLTGQDLYLWARGKIDAGKVVGQVMKSAWATVVPVQPAGGEDTAYSWYRAVIPTAAQPLVTVMSGENEFGTTVANQRPIDFDGKRITNPSAFETGKLGTPQFLKDFTEWAYESTGGMMDWSPASMDEFLKGYGGGVYAMFRNTVSPPMTTIGWGDNGTLQTITGNLRYRTDDYAVSEEYRREMQRLSTKFRMEGKTETGDYNVLGKSNPVTQIERKLQRQLDRTRVKGMTNLQLQGAYLRAMESGDELAQAEIRAAIIEMRRQRNALTGEALRQAKEIAGE